MKNKVSSLDTSFFEFDTSLKSSQTCLPLRSSSNLIFSNKNRFGNRNNQDFSLTNSNQEIIQSGISAINFKKDGSLLKVPRSSSQIHSFINKNEKNNSRSLCKLERSLSFRSHRTLDTYCRESSRRSSLENIPSRATAQIECSRRSSVESLISMKTPKIKLPKTESSKGFNFTQSGKDILISVAPDCEPIYLTKKATLKTKSNKSPLKKSDIEKIIESQAS